MKFSSILMVNKSHLLLLCLSIIWSLWCIKLGFHSLHLAFSFLNEHLSNSKCDLAWYDRKTSVHWHNLIAPSEKLYTLDFESLIQMEYAQMEFITRRNFTTSFLLYSKLHICVYSIGGYEHNGNFLDPYRYLFLLYITTKLFFESHYSIVVSFELYILICDGCATISSIIGMSPFTFLLVLRWDIT